MSIRVEGNNGRYSIVQEKCIGVGYMAVKVTKYAYIGIKNNAEGFRQYDVVSKDGIKALSIVNNRETYVEAGGISLEKDHFVVTYHQRMDTAETINQVAYDYHGNVIELPDSVIEGKSNRDIYYSETASAVGAHTASVVDDTSDDVM